MTKAELINEIKNRIGFDTDNETYAMSKDERDFYTSILKILEQKSCDDTVSRGVFEQVMWERDTAIEQLRKLGYELGQKIEPCGNVLDKISAEIEQNAYPIVHGVNNHELGMTLYGILQVIDKYRKEQTE